MGEDRGEGRSVRKRLTRQELIDVILQRKEELGRVPRRKDMPEGLMAAYKSEFGKWVYALEASGLRKPSSATLQRRQNRKQRMRELQRKSTGKVNPGNTNESADENNGE